jgi:hypothetical protein
LSESITVLKNDYNSKIEEVKTALDLLKQENVTLLESMELKLETSVTDKIKKVNDELIQKLNHMHESSVEREEDIIQKIDEISNAVEFVNKKMESVNNQLDEVQEKMYDFEQNKKNNLIFYGVSGEERENRDELRVKILNLLRMHLNMKREIPVTRVSRMMTGMIGAMRSSFPNSFKDPKSRDADLPLLHLNHLKTGKMF